jgi:hypothetical protein
VIVPWGNVTVHYTASQILVAGFDLRDTAARLGHRGGGATTLRHYADPVPEADRIGAAYRAQPVAGSGAKATDASKTAVVMVPLHVQHWPGVNISPHHS